MVKKGKFLFFDIECSNGHNICSFGYCLVDKNLHIVDKKDIIINPENKFILSAKGHRAKIELAYPQDYFYKQNNFVYFYPEIKKLLEKYILIGHSVKSDLLFLNYACQRYNLFPLKLSAYDSQKMFQILYKKPHVESLESILNQLEIDSGSLIFHRSCDDAKATFYVTRELAYLNDLTIEELLAKLPECKVEN